MVGTSKYVRYTVVYGLAFIDFGGPSIGSGNSTRNKSTESKMSKARATSTFNISFSFLKTDLSQFCCNFTVKNGQDMLSNYKIRIVLI